MADRTNSPKTMSGGCNISIQACEDGGLFASKCAAWAGTFSPYDSLCVAPPPSFCLDYADRAGAGGR